jgi:ABC-type multidrug transport system ATPase subunit
VTVPVFISQLDPVASYATGRRSRARWAVCPGLRLVELDLRRRIGDLSSGNRQRVGVVQAFMHEFGFQSSAPDG